jgi:DNA-binding MarR family transcriptional regulator
MERSLGWIWPRAVSRLYEEPKKLVAAGLASSRTEATGRRRSTVYSITPAGREALAAWLAEPGAGPLLECEARPRPAAPGPMRKPGDPAAGPVTYPSRRSRAAGAGTWEGFHMSVLVIGKFKGDTAKFQQALVDRADEFAKISEASKAVGGLHHRFGIGDGYVLIVDEWQSVEDFQKFMANPELQAFIGSVGGAPEPPEVIVAEAISSPDEF